MNENLNIESMLRGYLECALWASNDNSTDGGGEPLDANYSADDIASDAKETARADCVDFVAQATAAGIDFSAMHSAPCLRSMPADVIGHNLWLTRNRHGTGFWDRGYGAIGDKLSAIARHMGSCDADIGDDGKIYFG